MDDDDPETLADEQEEEKKDRIVAYLFLALLVVVVIVLFKTAASWLDYRDAVRTCEERPGLWRLENCKSRDDCIKECARDLRDGTVIASSLMLATNARPPSGSTSEGLNGTR